MRDIMENNLVKIYDEENEKFWFGVSEVNRYQDEEDDPWWNVRIIYKNHWVNYDEIWLDKEGLIKIYNCICDTLKYKKNRE